MPEHGMKGICELCRQPVEDIQTAAYPVTGWEVERYAGGANQIHGRERIPNRIAHLRPCLQEHLRRRKLNISDDQDSLLG